jgi:thiamine pyrophosphokinase
MHRTIAKHIHHKLITNNKSRFYSTTKTHIHYNDFYNGESKFNLVVLNTPYCKYPLFSQLFKLADTVVCADGGANQIYYQYHQQQQASSEQTLPYPDYICGDLDSVHGNVLNYYKQQNVKVVHVEEQDTNDLQKSLALLYSLKDAPKTTVIYGAGGRLDQEMCNLNSLYLSSHTHRYVLLSPFSCAAVLKPGKHKIRRNVEFERGTCALVPLGQPCRQLFTQGLKWNINHSDPKEPALSFGGLVSTSNEFDSDEVYIENSDAILWIYTLESKFSNE